MEMNLHKVLKNCMKMECSDVYISVGNLIFGRVNFKLEPINDKILSENDVKEFILDIFGIEFLRFNELYKTFEINGIGRFAANIFKEKSYYSLIIKICAGNYLKFSEKILPDKINNLITNYKNGLVLISGPSNSGKSSTIASILNEISIKYSKYIICIERFNEIIHLNNNSIINQIEVGNDLNSYINHLNSIYIKKPDVLIVDEIKNENILQQILKCCESGILVITTICSNSVNESIEYLLELQYKLGDYYKNKLLHYLKCIINQKLILDKFGKKMSLFEVMLNNNLISNYIRENKMKNVFELMQNGLKLGMCTHDMSLIDAFKNNKISKETFLQNIINKELVVKFILNY